MHGVSHCVWGGTPNVEPFESARYGHCVAFGLRCRFGSGFGFEFGFGFGFGFGLRFGCGCGCGCGLGFIWVRVWVGV